MDLPVVDATGVLAAALVLAGGWALWHHLSTDAKCETAVVSELWIYPIKSCRGIQVRHAEIDGRGLKFDRNFMVVSGPKVFHCRNSTEIASYSHCLY